MREVALASGRRSCAAWSLTLAQALGHRAVASCVWAQDRCEARTPSAYQGCCQSWRRLGHEREKVEIVAVPGDANFLTARRSTAARSAIHFHACGVSEWQMLLAKR
jgi:hypothetical protein